MKYSTGNTHIGLSFSSNPAHDLFVFIGDGTNTQTLARQANCLRKQILEEMRTGLVGGALLKEDIAPTSMEFKATIETVFFSKIEKQ